ncbi:hypothetical protein M433DRAFT_155603 [Acidomyces richmondensis BFW]|nr:MAG: hypothetical protein FE78DRAFT_92436 [Acidomyces sp. 'richmondensis']KYG44449.1 hypothetical protein M433DRAFT_155603 [Acidomyces richmondensis BFW]
MSVLLLVFILQLLIHLINTVGSQAVNDVLWWLYTQLPTPHSADAAALTKLRRDVVRLQRELNATSAQDDFATWARLRRQHDKAKDQYEKKSRNLQSFRSTFDTSVSTLRWLGTQGLQFAANFWFSKSAMFYLPARWVPWHVEWLLAFPRAPMGSVSINVWAIACASVIAMVSEGVRAAWVLKAGRATEGINRGSKLKQGL